MLRPRPKPLVRPTTQSVHLPAPTGGLNTVSAGSAMPPTDCVQLYNLVAAEYGLRSRLGSREWVTGLTGAADSQVRSVLPFTGAAANGAGDRLFAVTSTGIWDVSASTTTPVQVLVFPVQSGDAGRGVSHVVVTAGGHFLAYCDEENGYHLYSEATGLWVAPTMGAGPTEIAGVNPANLVFCTVFKNRLWLVEKATARAWYLDAGSVFGTATSFALGQRFRAGGSLVGLWSWTYDGGAGLDDSLVAVSGGGDVAIYQGADPASAATFGLKGVWTLGGSPPAGRHIATGYGGDLLLLTRAGVLSLSRLVAGAGDERATYATAKVSNLFNSLMLTRASLPGWSLRLHPEDNALLVTVPTYAGQATEQLVMSLAGRSWSRYRDLPLYSSEVWSGKLYLGTMDGRVLINDGYVDGVTLADPSAYTPVQWSLLSAFQNFGNGRMKRVQMLRPTLLSESPAPAYEARARFRYDLAEVETVSADTAPSSAGTWDVSTWDSAGWGGEYNASQRATGATGMGVDVAVAIRGAATSRTVLVGVDVMLEMGGML